MSGKTFIYTTFLMLYIARPSGRRDRAVATDRLGLLMKQLIETVTILGERGIELRSLKENIDTTTSTGKLMFHIIGAMAEFDGTVTSQCTQTAGLEAR